MATATSNIEVAKKKNITRGINKIRDLLLNNNGKYIIESPEQLELVVEQIHEMGERLATMRVAEKVASGSGI